MGKIIDKIITAFMVISVLALPVALTYDFIRIHKHFHLINK